MSRSTDSMRRWSTALLAAGVLSHAPPRPRKARRRSTQEYTAQIKKYLSDPRISTELVDHLPASSTVPTPLKFLGHIVGAPGDARSRRGHPSLSRGGGQGVDRPREVLEDRQDRRRARHRAPRDRRPKDDREPRPVQGLSRTS